VALSGEMPDSAAALAAKAVETGGNAASADGLLLAAPTRFGKTGDVVGAIVAQWSDARAAADIHTAAITVGMLGLGAAAVLGLVAVLMLRRGLSTPLAGLTATVTRLAARLAAGENAHIDGVGTKDEIGALARALLAIHQTGRRPARVRSALDCSGACVLIVDAGGKVIHTSAALSTLLDAGADAIRKSAPRFDPKTLLGAPLDVLGAEIPALLTTADGPRTERMEVGAMQLDLTAGPVFDCDRARIGAVVE
jgi:HAMP domain-containing protein